MSQPPHFKSKIPRFSNLLWFRRRQGGAKALKVEVIRRELPQIVGLPASPSDSDTSDGSSHMRSLDVEVSKPRTLPRGPTVARENSGKRALPMESPPSCCQAVSPLVVDTNSEPDLQTHSHDGFTVNGHGNSIVYTSGDHISSNVTNLYLDNGDSSGISNLKRVRTLADQGPNVLHITCVAIAFSKPPSVAQVSRVLRLPEEEVRTSIKDLAKILDKSSVELGDGIKLPDPFASTICSSLLQHMGRAHNAIACWCLEKKFSDMKDIPYSTQYWAWHVYQATPSVQLKTALENLQFNPNTITERELLGVISWLKNIDLVDVTRLILQYEDWVSVVRCPKSLKSSLV